jgi:beta-lactamase regulating signal transducer with metallopeptidase domain
MMFAAMLWGPVADWLGTFALHSTCALGGAWLLSAVLRQRAMLFQERLLRFSLWAALVSTTVQFAVLGSSLGWSLPVSAPVDPENVEFAALPPMDSVALDSAPLAVTTPPAWHLPQFAWTTWFVAVGVTMALFGAFWLVRVHARLRLVLRLRQPETDARVLATASLVAREQGLQQSPQLSRSPRLATPIAFGWLRPEICLPMRVGELGDDSLRAMLAHEIAHLRRGDPAWMWLAAGLQALFPWQLLLLAVRRRWSHLVELRCDAIAAQHSSPTAVARCLLDVADWLRPPSTMPIVALGMAARPSALRERIEAALQSRPIGRPRRLLSLAFGGLSLTSLTFAAPGVQTVPALPDLAVQISGLPMEVPAAAAASAPVAAPSARESLLQAFALLQEEHAELTAEVRQMQAEMRFHRMSPELEQLVSALQRRLLTVERLRSRLQAKLDRNVPK